MPRHTNKKKNRKTWYFIFLLEIQSAQIIALIETELRQSVHSKKDGDESPFDGIACF